MKRITISCIALTLFFACNAQDKPGNQHTTILHEPDFEHKVDALVKQYQDLDIFSGVVLIAEEGKPVYQKAFGMADRDRKIANTLNTKFDIGSMNKTFTKMVILQLVQEGKLKLTDKLSDIVPEFSDSKYNKITVAHLLNHTAGFGDYYMTPGYFDLPDSEKDIASLVLRIRDMPLLFEAGTERRYSNSGYILLGAIIEHITHKSYHENVKERIVIPLQLNETYLTNKNEVPNRAIGYFKNMKGEILDNNGFLDVPNPDGGFQSTAADVLKFYQEFYYGNQLITEETKQKDEFFSMIREHATTGAAIPIAGGFEGANTVDFEIQRDRTTIIVLANMNEPVAEQLGAGILAIIRGKEPEKPSLPAIENVYKAYKNKGLEYIKEHFDDLTVNFHPSDPKSLILNNIGYRLLFGGDTDQSIEIFKLNTELFPEDANVWDSLGEAYLKKGDKVKSLESYKKALSIDPGFASSIAAVRKLEN